MKWLERKDSPASGGVLAGSNPFESPSDAPRPLLFFDRWLGRKDSNPRMLGSEPSALPLGDSPMRLVRQSHNDGGLGQYSTLQRVFKECCAACETGQTIYTVRRITTGSPSPVAVLPRFFPLFHLLPSPSATMSTSTRLARCWSLFRRCFLLGYRILPFRAAVPWRLPRIIAYHGLSLRLFALLAHYWCLLALPARSLFLRLFALPALPAPCTPAFSSNH